MLLVETVFDTLEPQGGPRSRSRRSSRRRAERPGDGSVTITDESGRTLSGQTSRRSGTPISHAPLLAVGINCALGAKEMRPVHRGAVRPRAGIPERLPERRAPERVRRVRRDAREHVRRHRRLRARGLGEHRGGLLRHDARAHPRRSPAPSGDASAPAPRSPPRHPSQRPRALHVPARGLHDRRRAHERHGFSEVREARSRGRLRGGAHGGAPAGRWGRERSRREHGRGDAGREGRHDAVLEPPLGRARHRETARHARQLEVGRDRGRAEMPPGQVHRELDQPEGGRGFLPGTRPARAPLRRRGHRHGVRRGRTGDDRRATRSRSPRAPTAFSPRRSAFRPRTSSSTRTFSRSGPASRSTTPTR